MASGVSSAAERSVDVDGIAVLVRKVDELSQASLTNLADELKAGKKIAAFDGLALAPAAFDDPAANQRRRTRPCLGLD